MADINLTTTAVTPMTTTLLTLRARLRKELHDEDAQNYRWADATLDLHLQRALRELGLVLPREQKTTLQTTPGSRDLSIASLTEVVRIEAVEWPTGRWPPEYVPFSVYETTLTLLVEAAPTGAEDVHVYWGRLHTLDSSTSTLPAAAEDAVVLGAGGYAALEWASFATNRANVAGSDAVDDYRRWGEERLRLFREQLRNFGERARLRTSSLFRPQRPAGRDVVRWEQ